MLEILSMSTLLLLVETKVSVHLHAAKLEAVSVGLMMRGQVVVVENSNAKHR